MLADSATEIYAAQQVLADAVARHVRGKDVSVQCAMPKLFATETASRVVDRALQVHGGLGYLRGTRVERLSREVRALRITRRHV
jgi:acyl-CoA dehydrogenase